MCSSGLCFRDLSRSVGLRLRLVEGCPALYTTWIQPAAARQARHDLLLQLRKEDDSPLSERSGRLDGRRSTNTNGCSWPIGA